MSAIGGGLVVGVGFFFMCDVHQLTYHQNWVN